MMRLIVFIEEYSECVPQILAGADIGTVHSIFNNGVNILFKERLLFVGTRKHGRLPFGAHISKTTFNQLINRLLINSTVNISKDKKQLYLPNGITLSFESGKVFSGKLRKSMDCRHVLDHYNFILTSLLIKGKTTGLGVNIKKFVEHVEMPIKNDELKTKIRSFMNCLKGKNPDALEENLKYFLGRGQGLTPSGDDHIVGLLALQTYCSPFDSSFQTTLSSILKSEEITTKVASEYIVYALDGYFSSTIINFFDSLKKDHDDKLLRLNELIDTGFYSGVDIVFGILLGILTMRRNKNWLKR